MKNLLLEAVPTSWSYLLIVERLESGKLKTL
jgi:hypothetical protein